MRRLHLVWITACLAVGLSACSPLLAQSPKTPPAETPDTARRDIAKACAEWRWIGISRPEVRCPEVRGWTVRPLFPQLAPVRPRSGDYCAQDKSEKIPDPELIRELNRFCVYEIADPKQRSRDVRFPRAGTDLVRVDQDCAALSLSEKYLDSKKWPSDDKEATAFLAQAGKPESLIKTDQRLGVRLAFLDTQPTGVGVPTHQGNSPHGYTLARLAHELVCAPGSKESCAAQITTRLALPLLAFDPKDPTRNLIAPTRGGYFGMQSHLAQAIREEVDSWRADNPRQHLVLNLSMAWDGNLFGGLNGEQITELRAGTQAVYQALRYATSFDALVLTAAGNQKRKPCANYGPLLPAAWEEKAPQEERRRGVQDVPLLYAVGGLQADGKFLANARPGGMPRRAAYGETSLFAGSSVATAVASSIAAVVWNSFPELDSREVMQILDATVKKNQLQDNADFWFRPSSPSAPKIQRLSLCTALETACNRPGVSSCPIPIPCRDGESKGRLTPSGFTAAQGSCAPWLFPQPEDDPCMACIKPPAVQ